MARISLLLLTAAVTGTAVVGNTIGLAAAAADPAQPAQTRLGVAITEDIGKRDKAAGQRTRSLDLREQAVRAAEARLKTEAAAPPPVQAGATPPGAPPPPDQYDDLARIYQAMKPTAAALVLEQLDIDVQKRVAQKMRERSTAMILAAMTPKGAARLTMALAGQRTPAPTPAPVTARPVPKR